MVLKLLKSRMWQLGLLVLAVVVAFASGAGAAAANPTTPAPSPAPSTTDVQSMLENLLRALPLPGGPNPGNPVADTGQMIVVSVPEASSTTGTLTAFEKDANGQWKPVIGPTKAIVGEKGVGEPQDNVPRTPQGTFPLDQAFGRQDNPGTKMPYKKVDAQDWWDSNMQSPTYNRMVRQPNSPGGDSENLYNTGPMYDYAVNMAHNPSNTPGKASAMFLHVTDGNPTLGCVAIEREKMVEILKWLDPAKNPKISIGVNKSTPADVGDAPSLTGPQGDPLSGDALTGILDQFAPLIPQLLESVTGS